VTVLRVRRLSHAEGLPLPRYETEDAAGLDLVAANLDNSPLVLDRLARALVPTGLVLELPSGLEGQIRPRSGLALRHGITVLNSPGTIDADYRGEVMVLLVNLGAEAFTVRRRMRVAQLVIAPVVRAALEETAELGPSSRAGGGFGSTGL
jgi:dUTP pyrophosphatase